MNRRRRQGTLGKPVRVAVGSHVSWRRTFAEADVFAFANLSGDTNPLHLDATIAAQGRFKQRVVHGE